MPTPDNWRRLEVDSPAARLLTDHRSLRYFAPFLREPVNLSTAARAAGVSPQAMKYWLHKFLDADLIKAVSENHTGRSIRYKATAPAYLVPFEATNFSSMREWVENRLMTYHDRLLELLAASFESQGLDHLLIHLDPASGEVLQSAADEEGAFSHPSVQALSISHGFAGEVTICRERLGEIEIELARLWEKYIKEAEECKRKQQLYVYAFLVRGGS
ncbi:hypothetical protein [Oceanithermus sp.]